MTIFITRNGQLHRQSAVDGDAENILDADEVGHGRERPVLAQGVSSKDGTFLDEPLCSHVRERRPLHQNDGRLCEQRRLQQPPRVGEGVRRGVAAKPRYNGHGAARPIVLDHLGLHVEVVLEDPLPLTASEVDGEFLGVLPDDP